MHHDHEQTSSQPITPPHLPDPFYPTEADGVVRSAHAVEREAYAVEREAYRLEAETLNWIDAPVVTRWVRLHELTNLATALDNAIARAKEGLSMQAGEALLAIQRSALKLHAEIDAFIAAQAPKPLQQEQQQQNPTV